MKDETVRDGTVVVVGAGVCGLVAAHLLAEAGCEVVVVEREEELGGLARSFRYGEHVFDIGPHRFHTANPDVSAWLERVLDGEAVRFPRRSEVYFQDQYYNWPLKPENLRQLPLGMGFMAGLDLAMNSFRQRTVDSFESYVLNQYGETLYQHFFKDYSIKFLGIHPRDTHADWAKTGINRAIIDEKLQMHNLVQLARTTLLQPRSTDTDFIYPRRGMYQAWDLLGRVLDDLGVRVITGAPARLEPGDGRIEAVWAGDERIECGQVVWTAPITLALEQLDQPPASLEYLAMALYNVVIRGEASRSFQWCYYGQKDIVFNRVSIPRYFSDATSPDGEHGLCVEVTCREGDRRWRHAENLTDRVVDELVKVGLVPMRRAIHDVHVERVPESYPVYHASYPAELERAQESLAAWRNLHMAGRTGKFWYNNMDHSIEDAMDLVRRLLLRAGHPEVDQGELARGVAAAGP